MFACAQGAGESEELEHPAAAFWLDVPEARASMSTWSFRAAAIHQNTKSPIWFCGAGRRNPKPNPQKSILQSHGGAGRSRRGSDGAATADAVQAGWGPGGVLP